jgi:hypothetical protein
MLRLRDVGQRVRHLGRDDDQRLETWPSTAAVVMLREGSRFVMLFGSKTETDLMTWQAEGRYGDVNIQDQASRGQTSRAN